MKTRILLAASLACIGLLGTPATWAATAEDAITDRIGDTPVMLPNPPGFVATVGVASDVRAMLERSLPAPYRLIDLRVPQDYADKLRAHDPSAHMTRYCTFLAYRQYEVGGMSPALFAAIKKVLRDQAEKVMQQADAIAAGGADRFSKELGAKTGDASTTLKIGHSRSLGIIDEHPGSFALATIGPVSVSSKRVNERTDQVAVVAVALIHGKPVNANFYSDYTSDDDLAWAEDQARDWLRRLGEMNP